MKEKKEMKCKEEIIITKMQKLQIEKLKEKGITLIALVVTIIILLILAGVTLNIALGQNGLFSRARDAAERYKKAQEDEEELISEIAKEMYSEYVGAFVTGYTTKTGSCTIGKDTSGYTEAQEFTTDENMKWRIWDYDGRTIRLISSKPTEAKLQLTNVKGYNNGVWAINEICRECYSSNEPGVTVRNLRRSDIQKVSTYDYTEYKHKQNDWHEVIEDSEEDLIHYGESKTYIDSYKSPAMWSLHDKGWTYGYDKDKKEKTGSNVDGADPWEQEYGSSQQTGTGETTKDTQFKQSYYSHDYKDKQNEFINSKYYDMLFKDPDNTSDYLNKTYWLAGRYVLLCKSACNFGLHLVDANSSNCYVNGDGVFGSNRWRVYP